MTLKSPFKISYSDLLCILCAILYAFHIVLTEAFTKQVDSIALGVLQLGFVGALSFVFSIGIEDFILPRDNETLIVVLILGIFCTAFSYIVQTYAQRYTNSVHTGLILSLEPAFSATLAFFILKEVLFLRQYIGGIILLFSVLLVETE